MPFYQALVLVILFAWLRMAEVCRSPFDGDSVYDVHVEEEIDVQLFNASLALYRAKPPTFE